MKATRQACCAWMLATGAGIAFAQSDASGGDPLAKYLVDVTAAPVSASDMLGLSGSAVSNLAAPRDFAASVHAIASGASKDGFGLSITPARTRWTPMSIRTYETGAWWTQLLGNTSLSYAQGRKTIASVDYKQDAVAISAVYYPDPMSDPVRVARSAFFGCEALATKLADVAGRQAKEVERLLKANFPAAQAVEMAKANVALEQDLGRAEYTKCVDDAQKKAKDRWNATIVALSYGAAWITSADTQAERLSLGRRLTVGGAWSPAPTTLLNLSIRRTQGGLDVSTIGGAREYKSSSLAALRVTYRPESDAGTYALAEISNATATSSLTNSGTFKYALGLDRKITDGVWVEFRLGRSYTADGTSQQTAALLSLKLTPKNELLK